MVQTEQQYICIHQCLMAVLEGQENLNNIQRELHDNQGYEGMCSHFNVNRHPQPQCIFRDIIIFKSGPVNRGLC